MRIVSEALWLGGQPVNPAPKVNGPNESLG